MCAAVCSCVRDELDLVAHLVQRIEQADVAVTADAEHVRDFLLHQEFRDEFAAFLLRGLPAVADRGRQAFSVGLFISLSSITRIRAPSPTTHEPRAAGRRGAPPGSRSHAGPSCAPAPVFPAHDDCMSLPTA